MKKDGWKVSCRCCLAPDTSSLEPDELKVMVDAIRNIELALGLGIKKPSESEKPNMVVVRKSIVASRPIKKGEILSEENLAAKRPGNGISPMRWDELIGTIAQKEYEADELIGEVKYASN